MRMLVLAALAASVPLAHAAGPVDVCALLSKVDAEALIGKLDGAPTAGKPQGSLLGECDYDGANGRLSISARPANEFDQTVKFSSGKSAPVPAAGVPGKAFKTKYGVLAQPAGKPYFFQVLAYKGLQQDDGLAVEAAKKLRQ